MKKALGLLLLLAFTGVCVWRVTDIQKAKAAAARKGGGKRAVPVLVATATVKPMPVEIRTFGTVEPATTVTVRAQVTGTLAEIGFAEGDEVKPGQLLFRIDPRPFEADLRQAEGTLARTEAQLVNATNEARRVGELFAKGFVSENDRDLARTAANALRAACQADAAAAENARIRLGYCEIRAPVAGRAGRRLADAGNLVSANATALVTINQVAPVDVSFTIPQQEMFRVQGRAETRDLPVEALLPDDGARPERGVLTFLDNAVDRTTGTLALKARFANDARRLWPGQFVTVRMVVAVETNALVIPFRAVQNGQKGTYVYVLQPDATVTDRLVKVTRMVEEESVIGSGLEPGTIVVTDGCAQLAPGAVVTNSALRNAESGTRTPGPGDRGQGAR